MSNSSLILTIARHEYIVNVRRPGFIFFTLLIPALGLIGLLVAGFFSGQAARFFETTFTPSTANAPTGLVDESGLFTPLPAGFADDYRVFGDEAAGRAALLAGELNGLVVIPADYLASGDVTAYAVGGFFDSVGLDDDALRALLVTGLLAGRVDDAVLTRVTNPADVQPITLNGEGAPTNGGDFGSVLAGFLIPYVLSIFLIISIFTASSYLLRSVSEEKETRVIEVVLSSVTAAQLLTGKVLGLGALGLTQVLVWLASTVAFSGGLGAVVAGLVVSLNPLILILSGAYFLLGYLLYGTLMASAGALGTSQRESQQMAGIFSFGAAVPFMFNSLIFANPNGAVARFLSIFPLTAPTAMMLRLPITTVGALDLALSLGGLLVTIPLALWAGGKVFRMGLLLYGKRPSLKQIALALRQA
ncbi:MAG: ABC transporter permease [Anaerolineales bacterium]|nr:ABC transporter permease [Anaerolineales bacterium]